MGILIIDDDAVQRLALAAILEDEGYANILLAASAEAAYQILAQAAPEEIDLILTDLHMPNVDGIAACSYIKSLEGWEDIPIIMVTSSEDAENLKLAFAAGAMDYITKPPNEVELRARIRSALKLKHEMDKRKAREQELQQLNHRLEIVLNDLAEQHFLLQSEQEKSERLLLNILPKPIADRLKQEEGRVIADSFEQATVLFADIVDFTRLSAQAAPDELVELLSREFSLFDALAEKHGLEKIKTIGDAYMVVGGVPMPRADHAEAVAEMALDMLNELPQVTAGLLKIRIGIHTGPVVAGVIGTKKFAYDLWGDTVNIASRMESQGRANCIQVTEATYALLADAYEFAPRGKMLVKGVGEMNTYFLTGRKAIPDSAALETLAAMA